MEFFWIIWIIALVATLFKDRTGFITFLITLMLVLFAGLRAVNVDRDYGNYTTIFNSVNSFSDVTDHKIDVEFSFKLMCYLIKSIGLDISSLMLLIAAIAITINISIYKKISPIFSVALIVYISNFYILKDMTQVRAGLANAFFLIALFYFDKNKYKYFFWTFVATLAHFSFIITIPLWFVINNTKKRLIQIFAFAAASTLIAMSKLPIAEIILKYSLAISPKIQYYILALKDPALNAVNIFGSISLLRIFISIILVYLAINNKIIKPKLFLPFIQIYVLGIGFFNLLSGSAALAIRLSEILFVVEPILISLLVYTTLKYNLSIFSRVLIFLFLIAYSATIFMKILAIMNPYSFVELL